MNNVSAGFKNNNLVEIYWYESSTGVGSPQPFLNVLSLLLGSGQSGHLSKVFFFVADPSRVSIFPEFSSLLGNEKFSIELIQTLPESNSLTQISQTLSSSQFVIPLSSESKIDIAALRQLLTRNIEENANAVACIPRGLSIDISNVIYRPEMILFPWLQMGYKIPESNFLIESSALVHSQKGNNFGQRAYAALEDFAAQGSVEIIPYDGNEKITDPLSRWRHIPAIWKNPSGSSQTKKVLIVGNYGEYHHLQLCFLDYLRSKYNSEFSFVAIDTKNPGISNLIYGSDLVIFSRVFGDILTRLIDVCDTLSKPNIFMLDDNWFTLANDLGGEYREKFGLETQNMETFVQNLNRVSKVITYSKYLLKYITKFVSNVIYLPPSVNLEHFHQYPRQFHLRTRIGFAGSLRFADTAFEGLAQVCANRDDLDVYMFGILSEKQKKLFQEFNVTYIPFVSYEQYVRQIRAASLDVLISPLGNSHSESSKVINKYLEITAAGAVGIYSNVEPYSSVISQGINGWLVQSDATSADWKNAILTSIDQYGDSIIKNAEDDIRSKYSFDRAAKALFVEFNDVLTMGEET